MTDVTIVLGGLRKRFGPNAAPDGMSFTIQRSGRRRRTANLTVTVLHRRVVPYSEAAADHVTPEAAHMELTRTVGELRGVAA